MTYNQNSGRNSTWWKLFASLLVLAGMLLVLSAAYGFVSTAVLTDDIYLRAKALAFAGGILLAVGAFSVHGIK